MKKCPYCAEEIQDDAIKCKHCGEWLNSDTQTRSKINNNTSQEIPFSEKSKITNTPLPGTTAKTEVTEKQFKRFKIFTILLYIIFFAFYLIKLPEDTNYEATLTMIWAVCFVIVVITFWGYLSRCVKIIQKKFLYYIALCIFVPFIGAAYAYTRIKSHYDNPSPEKW